MKIRLTLFLLTIFVWKLSAQYTVPPCPMPGQSIMDAPLLDCCLDGYSYAMQPPIFPDAPPPGFCGTIENQQWLAWQAPQNVIGIKLSIEVSNCIGLQGIQLHMYDAGGSCDLFSLVPVSDCVETTTTDTITAMNLTPGHVYYILLDGYQGDICDYTLDVIHLFKCTQPPPTLNGPSTADPGQTATYTVLFPPPSNCPFEPNNPCGNIKQDNIICVGQCSGGSDPLTFTWTGPAGSSVTPSADGLSANVTFGTESGFVRVLITGPCYYLELEIYVTVCTIQPPILPSSVVADCFGSAFVFVNGSNYVDYQWSDGASGNPAILFGQGVFVVTVTDVQGCTATASTFVLQPATPNVFLFGPSTPICLGEAAMLTTQVFGGPVSYSWSAGVSGSGSSVTASTAGTYSVTVTNNFGCTESADFAVNSYPPVVPVTLPALSLCQSELPYDFLGEPVTSSGNYQVVLQNWQGCDSIVNQSITVQPPVDITVTSSVGLTLPIGGTATLEAAGGNGLGSYAWLGGQMGNTITVNQPGTYTVVYSEGQCQYTASINLVQATANCPQHNQPVAPADSCHTAPPFCASYLNGYCSTNDGYTLDLPGNLASAIPCTLENNQWLKFNACSTEVRIELAVSNCLASNGLEFFILQTTDCQIFAAQAACFSINSGDTDTLEATGLSPGETYYLMVDGLAGDVCDWQVLSTLGISEGAVYQAVNTPGQVVTVDPAQEEVCGGTTVSFTFEPAICQDFQLVSGCPAEQQFCAPFMDTCVVVVRYDTVWHVMPYGWGAVFENNDSIGSFANVIYPSSPPPSQAGADSLFYTTSVEFIAVEVDTVLCWNSCVAECSTVLSAIEPCIIRPKEIKVCFPNNSSEYHVICPGQCITSLGETYCAPGSYTIESIGPCGCINTHVIVIDMIFDFPPFVGAPAYDCSPDGSTYMVSFQVGSSNGFDVLVNGVPVNGIFTSEPIPSGNSYSFIVEQVSVCGVSSPIIVAGSHTCQPCTGVTNDLGTIQLCPGGCYSLQGNSYCNPGSYTEQLLNPATNCLDTYIFTLAQTIENQLLVGVATEICDASSQYYSVGFPIVDGTPPYAVNGNPITGSFYQSGLIQSGQPYAFTVTDAATCAPQQVNIAGVFDCACINDPGTAQLNTLYGCEGEMVSVEFNNDAVSGTGDLHVFILHSGTNTSLGNIVGMNTTGTFAFVPGAMSFGQTYHISPAVGPDLGGTVDMSAACFQFGPGQPVVFYRQPAAQIMEPDTLTCLVNSLMLNGLATDGSGDYGYHWDGPGSYSASVPNPMIGQPGPYALTVTDNLTGCSTQAAVAVPSDTQPPVFTVNSGEINCQQATDTLEAASQMSGVSYSWTFPTGDVVTGPSISTNIPGDYAVTAIGPNGCTANAATFVDENGTPPSLSATGGSLACNQTTATLNASSNDPTASFAWTLPDGTTATGPTLQATQLGVYQVVALAQNGCSAEAEAEVTPGTEPVLSARLTVTPPSCFSLANGLVEVVEGLGGSAPYSFSLESIGAGQSFTDLQAGDYLLQITDANGCTGDTLLQLAEPVALEAEIGEDRFIAMGESVSLSLETNTDPASVLWFGPDGQHWEGLSALNLTPMKSGGYTVVVLDENDCSASDTAFVYVNGQGSVYLPNAFSPNGDNRNDRLTVFAGADVKAVVSMKIYDRWGELVFEDKDFSPNDDAHGWNGEHEGRPLDAAVFIVTAEVEFLDGSRKVLSGDLVLLR